MTAPFGGQTFRERQEIGDAWVGHLVHHVPPLPPGRHKAAPLQARQVVRDPAARGAGDGDEFRDRALSFKERLEHVEARGISKDPEVPRLRGQSQCRWRAGITQTSNRSHGLTITGFPVNVKRKSRDPMEDRHDNQQCTGH